MGRPDINDTTQRSGAVSPIGIRPARTLPEIHEFLGRAQQLISENTARELSDNADSGDAMVQGGQPDSARLRETSSSWHPYTLLHCNVTFLTSYNRKYGIKAGDRLLDSIAGLLQKTFPGDLIGHIGADHFTVLTQAKDVDHRVRKLNEHIRALIDKEQYVVGCKFAAYEWTDPDVTAEEALTCAETANRAIHDDRRQFFIYYTPEMKAEREMSEYILEHINDAVSRGWIQVWYQPIVRAVTGRVCALEALSRWNDPVHGLMAPYLYVGTLEERGLIWKLDACIVGQVCRLYASLAAAGREAVPVTLNLSRQDFLQSDIFRIVENSARSYGVPRDFLHIEITEGVFADNDPVINASLQRFRSAGYQIWVDDFGSGYASLNMLKDYDYDTLKVDMGFLRNDTARARSIIRSIVELNDRLGGQCLVEGVETREQFEFLRGIGCDMMQGYYIGKPLPYEEWRHKMRNRGKVIEERQWRSYYDSVSNVNMTTDLPTTILENRNGHYHFLLCNKAFGKILEKAYTIPGKEETPDCGTDHKRSENLARFEHELGDSLSPGSSVITKALRTGRPQTVYIPLGTQDVRAKLLPLATHRGSSLYKMEIYNLTSPVTASDKQRSLALRSVFCLYDDIYLINYTDNTITGAFRTDVRSGPEEQIPDIRKAMHKYCQKNIFPEDRRSYLAAMDPEHILELVNSGRSNHFQECFRTRLDNGSYEPKVHILIYTPLAGRQYFLYCIRALGAQAETLRKMAAKGSEAVLSSGQAAPCGFDSDDLLRSMLNFSKIPFFIKDKQRRFVAVSQSFLDIYGFGSDRVLIGKTDEQMHWHVDDGPFQANEIRVLTKGESVLQMHGQCIIRGVSHDIIAAKMPIWVNGEIRGLIGTFFKTGQMLDFQEQARQVPITDAVTSMQNIRGIMDTLTSYDRESHENGSRYAIITCDVPSVTRDRERYGKIQGEAEQQAVSEAIRAAAANTAAVGHYSETGFILLFKYVDPEQVHELCARIRRKVGMINRVGDIPTAMRAQLQIIYSEQLQSEGPDIFEDFLADMTTGMRTQEEGKEGDEAPAAAAYPAPGSGVEAGIRQILRESPQGACIYTPDRTIVSWNPAAEHITGCSSERILGRSCSESGLGKVCSGFRRGCTRDCPILSVLVSGEPRTCRCVLNGPGGNSVKVQSSFSPIRDHNGTAIEVLEMFTPQQTERPDRQKGGKKKNFKIRNYSY